MILNSKTWLRSIRKRSAFTLVELLVGLCIASILGGALLSLVFYTSRSFAALANYVDLDAYSKNALDRLTNEIRQTRRLTSGNNSRLVFQDFDGKTLIYLYDAKAKTLTRTKDGVADKEPLLRQCDSLKFSMFQRNPKKGSYDQYPSATPSTCKLIQVQWTCSRDLIYAKWNTESILSAKIVIRNNPTAKGAVPPNTI
jgi:type II secretory pathway pseudopilin PulG